MESLEKLLVAYDYETQKRIRELYKCDKIQLILHILNIEDAKNEKA
jgi:hypothetical protein